MIPFFLDRLDEGFPTRLTGLDRSIAEYVKSNVYITPIGMFNHAQLQFCAATLGTDRIMYSVDYPFIGNDHAKEAIAHGTAEKLLSLPA